jgi:hypothetical protein
MSWRPGSSGTVYLPSNCEALSSNPAQPPKKKKKSTVVEKHNFCKRRLIINIFKSKDIFL